MQNMRTGKDGRAEGDVTSPEDAIGTALAVALARATNRKEITQDATVRLLGEFEAIADFILTRKHGAQIHIPLHGVLDMTDLNDKGTVM